MKLHAIFFCFLFFCGFTASAQYEYSKHTSLPCINKEFSITVHHIRDSLNTFEPPVINDLQAAIDTLNHHFAPICVSFKVCEIREIENYQYYTPEPGEWPEMHVQYNQERTINLFLTSPMLWFEDGFAHADSMGVQTSDSLGIMIDRNYMLNPDINIAHVMGHYFGLYHTFRNSGEENADGSNCETAGDLICDTPADPYYPDPLIQWVGLDQKDEPCRFIYEGFDANGQYYVPHTSNIMSYYPTVCKCGFTYEQYRRMADVWYASKVKW